MSSAVTQTFPVPSTVRRVLGQQGVGGRSRALRNRMIRRTVGLFLFAIVLSIVHVWSRIKVLEMRYAMSTLQREVDALQQQMSQMEMAVTALKAPERLERVAKESLGMQLPAVGQVIFVREGHNGKAGHDTNDESVRRTAPASH